MLNNSIRINLTGSVRKMKYIVRINGVSSRTGIYPEEIIYFRTDKRFAEDFIKGYGLPEAKLTLEQI